MKIFGFSIYREKGNQDKKNLIVYRDDEENEKERLTIDLFRDGLESIEDPKEPYRFEWAKVIEVALLHPTVAKSLIIRESFMNFCTFKWVDKNGNHIENLDDVLKAKWFRAVKDYAFDSIVTGHELIQLKDLTNIEKPLFEKYPNWLLLTSLNRGLLSSDDTVEKSVDYTDKPYMYANINCRYDKYGHGILLPIIQEIAATSVSQWATETKSFTNTRVFTTGSWEDAQKKNYMSKIDRNRDGILLKQGETFDIVSASNDSSNGHKILNDYLDKQIQGVILGSSISDEKSFVGSVEVQKELLEMIVSRDRDYICDCINDSICLQTYGLIPAGAKLTWEKSSKMSEANQIEMYS